MSHKVFIASDHAGFALKEQLKSNFPDFDWQDLGPTSEDRVDYPDFAQVLCSEVIKSKYENLGVLICGSGQGMAISANKHPGIRAALCWSPEIATLSRQHNNANVLCLSARHIDLDINKEIVKAFFSTDFEGGRHLERVQKIEKL